MQKSQLEAEVSRLLNDSSNQRWPLTTIDTRLDFAQTDILVETNAVKTTETLTPVANVATVNLSSNLLDVLEVTLTDSSGNVFPLNGTYKEQLDLQRPLWRNETAGQPDSYFIDFTNAQLNLVPTPSAQWAIANAISVLEIQQQTSIASSGSTAIPFGSNLQMVPYHQALVFYTVSICLMDNNDDASLQKALYFRSGNYDKPGQYEIMLKKIINRFDKPTDERGRILWQPQGGRLGGWPVSKSTPLG